MRLGILWLGAVCAVWGGDLKGVVRSSLTAEPVARVKVAVSPVAAVTDSRGRFHLRDLPPGPLTVRVSAVGFRTVRKTLSLAAGETQSLDIVISPDTFAVTDSVEVKADPFDLTQTTSPTNFALETSEIKDLGSVLADDPLRSVHTAPGVVSNDDFNAQFSIHSAPFDRVGIYLDDVLLHSPLHTVAVEGSAGGSTAVFNSEMIRGATVETAAPPARYEDRTAGVVDIDARDPDRSGLGFSASVTASSASLLAEGPLGKRKRGGWLASFRKSYLQYLISRTSLDEPSMVFGFTDAQVRANYDITRRNSLSLSFFEGTSGLDRTRFRNTLGLNAAMLADTSFSTGVLGWTWTQSDRFMLSNRAAWIRETSSGSNPAGGPLGSDAYGEWVGSSTASVLFGASAPLEFGVTARRIRGDMYSNLWTGPAAFIRDSQARGTFLRTGGFFQQGLGLAGNRIRLSAGARWDTATVGGTGTVFSPQASAAFLPFGTGTRFSLSWGQYAQWPAPEALFGLGTGSLNLLPERATHYVASVEQRLGDRARLRLQAWDRQDRDLVSRPLYLPRLFFQNNWQAPFQNSMRGYARGVEILLQQRTANRLSGWISYSLSWARSFEPGSAWFPSDYDQRHAVNVFLSYRLSPSVTLATRTSYGSGMPVPGFYQLYGASAVTTGGTGNYRLDSVRNALRLPAYERTDVRLDKAWAWEHWKLTLYAEVENVLNRRNLRFDSFDGYNPQDARVWMSINRMFPILPAAGLKAEF